MPRLLSPPGMRKMDYDPPTDLPTSQTVNPIDDGCFVNCAQANKVYDTGFDTSILTGNVLTAKRASFIQIIITMNDWDPAVLTGSNTANKVTIYATDDADATAVGSLSAGSLKIGTVLMTDQSVVWNCTTNEWNKGKLKLASSVAAKYQVTAQAIYI